MQLIVLGKKADNIGQTQLPRAKYLAKSIIQKKFNKRAKIIKKSYECFPFITLVL